MPLTPMITSTTTTTSSRTARLEDWKTALIAVCGALCVGLLGLAGLWIKKHNDRKPKPIVKPVQVEPVKAPQQPTPGEWMEMVSLLRSEAAPSKNPHGNLPPSGSPGIDTPNTPTSTNTNRRYSGNWRIALLKIWIR